MYFKTEAFRNKTSLMSWPVSKKRNMLIFQLFGVHKYYNRLMKQLIWKVYQLATIFYFSSTWLLMMISFATRKRDVMSEIFLFFLFGKTNTLIVAFIIKLKEKDLKHVLGTIANSLKRQSLPKYLSLKRTDKIVVLVVCSYIVTLSVLSSLYGVSTSGRQYTERRVSLFCLSCDLTRLHPTLLNLTLVLQSAAYVIFDVGYFISFFVAFMLVATALNKMAENVNEKLELMNKDAKIFVELLPVVRKDVDRLRDVVDELNKYLQFCVLYWYLGSLVFSCMGLHRIIHLVEESQTSSWILAFQILDNFQCTCMVLVGTVLGSKLPATVEKGLSLLHKLGDVASRLKVADQILLLQAQLSNPVIAFSVGGCSNMTKSLLISYLGVLITYLIVYIQMSPDLLAKLHHLSVNNIDKINLNCTTFPTY